MRPNREDARKSLAEARAKLGALIDSFEQLQPSTEICEDLRVHVDAIASEVHSVCEILTDSSHISNES